MCKTRQSGPVHSRGGATIGTGPAENALTPGPSPKWRIKTCATLPRHPTTTTVSTRQRLNAFPRFFRNSGADELAAKMGIDRNSPYRAGAAVQYTLQDLASQGHVGYPEPGVVEHTTKLVEIDQLIVEAAVKSVLAEKTVIRESVEGESWLYLTALHRAEVGLAQSVHRIASATPHPMPVIDVEKAIGWIEGKLAIKLAALQQEAIRQACQQKMLVITGGPGVGKTTLVRSILEVFQAKKMKCVLAAPTGRAAKRMAETTSQTAKTIHRLLEFDPATGDFKRNQQHPLTGDLFVLDEVSMVDVVLGHQLLRAVPSNACVILVGDVDQLPSVGPGSVLADLIASGVVPVVRLTEIFRLDREVPKPLYSDEEVISYVRTCHSHQAPMTFNVGIYQDGTMAPASLEQLHRLGVALGKK